MPNLAQTMYDFAEYSYRAYGGIALSTMSRFPLGTNIFDEDWDVMVILDTCRVDALQEVASQFDFINDVESKYSVGSSTSEWIAQTFDRSYISDIQDTIYISGNGWSEAVLQDRVTPEAHADAPFSFTNWDITYPEDFQDIEHAWKYEIENPFGLSSGHPHPRIVTDSAVDIARRSNPKRLIIHYSQPHEPYISNALNEDRDLYDYERDPWAYLRSGGRKEKVWNAYIDDLKFVLEHVSILLDSITAENVVISADHGEAFGEYRFYGHGAGVLHPRIKIVPWATTTAHNSGVYQPDITRLPSNEQSVEEQLKALGYK